MAADGGSDGKKCVPCGVVQAPAPFHRAQPHWGFCCAMPCRLTITQRAVSCRSVRSGINTPL
eukprot:3294656-Alexandrium_andersonii.AAC.1